MIEITVKLRGEQASGKTRTIDNVAETMKLCPYPFRAEFWTKQPASPVWTRELVLSNVNGQREDWTTVTQEEEPS